MDISSYIYVPTSYIIMSLVGLVLVAQWRNGYDVELER